MSDAEKFSNENPFLPSGWGPASADAAQPVDDPISRAIARMQRTRPHEGDPLSVLRLGRDKVNARDTDDLQQQIQRVEARLGAVITSLNAATIDAVCNEDGTITVTLTLPNFPSAGGGG